MTVERIDALAMTELETWAKDRGMGGVDRSRLPATGVWVPYVACVFFYHTASAVTYVDSLIANPKARPRDVHRAVVELTEHSVKVNKDRLLVFYSMNKGVCAILDRVVGPPSGRGASVYLKGT